MNDDLATMSYAEGCAKGYANGLRDGSVLTAALLKQIEILSARVKSLEATKPLSPSGEAYA